MSNLQTRLEEQFSGVLIEGLQGPHAFFWTKAASICKIFEMKLGKDNIMYKELMHRIIEEKDIEKVTLEMCEKANVKEDIQHLLSKI